MISIASNEEYSQISPDKTRYSSSTIQSNQNSEDDFRECRECSLPQEIVALRTDLFQTQIPSLQISAKINQKAINWIITVCWNKSQCDQCVWLAILLYYSFKLKRNPRKDILELLLLVCIFLASKMTNGKGISIIDLLKASNGVVTAEQVIQMEFEILQILGFNLVIPHHLQLLWSFSHLNVEVKYKVSFLCELFMTQSHSIFFDQKKIKRLTDFIQGQSQAICRKQKDEILDLLRLKSCKIIELKYRSKFDVESLNSLLL